MEERPEGCRVGSLKREKYQNICKEGGLSVACFRRRKTQNE